MPPEIIPLVSNQKLLANETEPAGFSFRIDSAVPPVMVTNIHWFYSADFAHSLLTDGYVFEGDY